MQLPIIRVPLGLPLYRMSNGRTQTHQLAHIAEKGLPADYFSAGQENDTAQQIQHEILRNLAKEGTESITPIIDELALTKQTEPLLVTPAGVIVNGNRRLAAMRELYFSDRQTEFASFAHVECAVLPPLSDDQVEDIEVRLQMRPETKLPYGWIDESLKIQKLMNGRKEDEIVRLMRKKSADIKRALSALKYAEIYLNDWLKRPKHYQLVESGEQFFSDLVTRLRTKEGELLEANMRMAWVLFDNRLNLGSRIYDFNRVLGEKAPDVLTKLAERLEVDLTPTTAESDGGEFDEPADDDIEIDLGEAPSGSTTYGALIAVLDDPTRREDVADELRAVCQTIIDAGKTAKEGRAALAAVQDANTRLTEADLTKADPKTYNGIQNQLEEIIHRATELKVKVQQYKSGGGPAALGGTST
jgi:hypothetical protein